MSMSMVQTDELIQTEEQEETLDLRELADIDLAQSLSLDLAQEESLHLTVNTGFGSALIFLTYEGFFTIVVKEASGLGEVTLVEDVLFSHFPPNRKVQQHGW